MHILWPSGLWHAALLFGQRLMLPHVHLNHLQLARSIPYVWIFVSVILISFRSNIDHVSASFSHRAMPDVM